MKGRTQRTCTLAGGAVILPRYATILIGCLHSSGILNQTPPSTFARHSSAGGVARLSGKRVKQFRLPAYPGWGHRRSCPPALPLRTHHCARRMGEGIKAGVQSLVFFKQKTAYEMPK